ncbi:MAG: M23 family metallopeptidase [Myxococcota bacterium]
MRRILLVTLLLLGCATPAPRKISFEEAAREGGGAGQVPPAGAGVSLEPFLTVARRVRLASAVGAPMPEKLARAWQALLDDVDAFAARPAATGWTTEATRLRLQVETEFQTDAHAFGDVPAEVAERVPKTLRALSRRLTALTAKKRVVDPRRFAWPVEPVVVSSPYGSRVHPIAGEPRFHAGIDLEAPRSHPIRAAETGTVVFAGWNGNHGKQIELQHDPHWATRYSHLDAVLVRSGTVVQRGQVIGLAGETGLATGPHLHFELRQDGEPLDPEFFLRLPPTGPALISELP